MNDKIKFEKYIILRYIYINNIIIYIMSDINLYDFNSYSINNIKPQCYNYYPTCVHNVSILLINNLKIDIFMKGDEIAKYYNYHNIDIPYHFNEYICDRSNLN